jgi:biopolymer transport protein ExbB
MIKAFAVLGQAGITDPAALSEKISEVLIATAGGLAVAIPAFIFYYVLRNRAQAVVIQVDSIMNRLLEDIPYADLSGIKIGENFSAGAAVYADPGYSQETA